MDNPNAEDGIRSSETANAETDGANVAVDAVKANAETDFAEATKGYNAAEQRSFRDGVKFAAGFAAAAIANASPEDKTAELIEAVTDASAKPTADDTVGLDKDNREAFHAGAKFASGHLADVLAQADPMATRETLVALVRTNTPD